jgi:hypothetical protein
MSFCVVNDVEGRLSSVRGTTGVSVGRLVVLGLLGGGGPISALMAFGLALSTTGSVDNGGFLVS